MNTAKRKAPAPAAGRGRDKQEATPAESTNTPAPTISGNGPDPARLQGLAFERGRGWVTRFTINCGPAVVGRRIRVRLLTDDQATAIARRDAILAALAEHGFRVAIRPVDRSNHRRKEAA